MKQWECPVCKQWVPADWWRHSHIARNSPSLTALLAARNQGIDLTDSYVVAETYLRTGKEPTREEPV